MRIEGTVEEIQELMNYIRGRRPAPPRTETVLTGTVYPLPPIQQPGGANTDRPDPLGLNQIRNDLRGNPGPPPRPLGPGPSIDEFRTYTGESATPEPIQRFEDPVPNHSVPAPHPNAHAWDRNSVTESMETAQRALRQTGRADLAEALEHSQRDLTDAGILGDRDRETPRPFTRGRVGRAVERTPPEGRIVNARREIPAEDLTVGSIDRFGVQVAQTETEEAGAVRRMDLAISSRLEEIHREAALVDNMGNAERGTNAPTQGNP